MRSVPAPSVLARAASGGIALYVAVDIVLVFAVLGTRITTRALARDPRSRRALPPLAVLSWGALVPVLLLGRAHLRPHPLGGLYEKVFLGIELAWFLVAAVWIAVVDRTA